MQISFIPYIRTLGMVACLATLAHANDHAETLRHLGRAAAKEQFAGVLERRKGGEVWHGVTGNERFKKAADIYRATLAYIAKHEVDKAPDRETAAALSAIYTRMLWFAYQTSMDTYIKVDRNTLMEEAVRLNPHDPLTLFVSVSMKTFRDQPNADQIARDRIDRALELRPEFPEALMLQALYYRRMGDDKIAERNLSKFLACLDKFSPELVFYDTIYPAPNHHIAIGEDEILESRDYPLGDERFEMR
ncbi:hypothetical protein [Synoicihabitans lomoniglobus]|uniref:Tetratricopeptide repeat protein n=1 Tax=Synoicihabitans lomoniglobus TaxID=2909285 RepID=A0AAE9ZXJ5_9BACT|nr:hypothetical protein [Opitutaceae bacterium LMO-M01]WED65366.1 hypothetical protein PXH66_00700 [Opitutaceae bacterium LMO-M01]